MKINIFLLSDIYISICTVITSMSVFFEFYSFRNSANKISGFTFYFVNSEWFFYNAFFCIFLRRVFTRWFALCLIVSSNIFISSSFSCNESLQHLNPEIKQCSIKMIILLIHFKYKRKNSR